VFSLEKATTMIEEPKKNSHTPGNPTGLPVAEPVDVLELVSFQSGAIVSKTLSNSKCGTVTLFAFDQGQGLSEHASPYNALVQILEGSAEVFVSGKRMQANQGQLLVLPANQPHALNALSKFKMLLTMIRAE
jgi:quercetin dioxygenase-like cupin family protein